MLLLLAIEASLIYSVSKCLSTVWVWESLSKQDSSSKSTFSPTSQFMSSPDRFMAPSGAVHKLKLCRILITLFILNTTHNTLLQIEEHVSRWLTSAVRRSRTKKLTFIKKTCSLAGKRYSISVCFPQPSQLWFYHRTFKNNLTIFFPTLTRLHFLI